MPEALLFVDHALAAGGAEQSLRLLLLRLDPARWTPFLAGMEGAFLESIRQDGHAVRAVALPRLRRSPSAPADWRRGTQALAQAARETGAAALIANTVRVAIYCAPAARLARRPFVWHMRDFWLSENTPRRQRLDSLGKRLLIAAAALVITNSHAVAGRLPRSKKVHVVHNGIDITQFDSLRDGQPFRRRHGIPADAPLVGMAGRLRPWKGQESFLRMAALLHSRRPEAHFVVVGGSPLVAADEYEEHLRRMVTDLGLAGRVTFTGHLADVAGALAAFDCFVHPGAPEPFGLVNIEAMAMARPVAAFAHGALPEIVLDSVTGRLVPPGDIEALARAVETLLAEPERAKLMGRAGRTRVEQYFTADRVAREIDPLLTQLLDKRGAGR